MKSEVLEGAPYCQRHTSSSSPVFGGVPHDCEGTLKIPKLNLTDGERSVLLYRARARVYVCVCVCV